MLKRPKTTLLVVNQWLGLLHLISSVLLHLKVLRLNKRLTPAVKTAWQLLMNAELIITIKTVITNTSTYAASLELVAPIQPRLTKIRCTSAAGVVDAAIIPTKLTSVQKELSDRTRLLRLSARLCINTLTLSIRRWWVRTIKLREMALTLKSTRWA